MPTETANGKLQILKFLGELLADTNPHLVQTTFDTLRFVMNTDSGKITYGHLKETDPNIA